MSNFTLALNSPIQSTRIEGVSSFVGEDDTGSFGILAGHDRLMTTLVIGLARYRVGEGEWQYLAMPGAVLYFNDNTLTLCTRRYLQDSDYNRINTDLKAELLSEEARLQATRESLRRLEEEVLRRMWELGRREERYG